MLSFFNDCIHSFIHLFSHKCTLNVNNQFIHKRHRHFIHWKKESERISRYNNNIVTISTDTIKSLKQPFLYLTRIMVVSPNQWSPFLLLSPHRLPITPSSSAPSHVALLGSMSDISFLPPPPPPPGLFLYLSHCGPVCIHRGPLWGLQPPVPGQ